MAPDRGVLVVCVVLLFVCPVASEIFQLLKCLKNYLVARMTRYVTIFMQTSYTNLFTFQCHIWAVLI